MKPVIFVDGHVLDGKPQGSSAYIAGLYGAVAETGAVELKIATHNAESLTRWQLSRPGIDWVPLFARNKYHRLGVEMVKLQSRISPDYAHFQYITPVVKRCEWINTLHDLLFLDHPQHFPSLYRLRNAALFRLSALRSEIILTVSNYSREAIHRHFGIDKARIHVTHNAIDSFVGAPEEAVEDLTETRFLVYVSRFEPRKNQHKLVRVFNDMRCDFNKDIRLVLVGYSALPYPELDAALGLAGEGVKVLNSVSSAQLTWLYRHAVASIYPSLAEGFGMPAIEAVAADGISYCANNTAMSELAPFVHGTFNANSTEQIRATILRAFEGQNCKTRNDLKHRVIGAFSWKSSAETLLEAIDA